MRVVDRQAMEKLNKVDLQKVNYLFRKMEGKKKKKENKE